MIEECDINGDGRLDMEEFITMMKVNGRL